MTAAQPAAGGCLDGDLWETQVRPRLGRGADEPWWEALSADPVLAAAVYRHLRRQLADINDQLGQRGANMEAGVEDPDGFYAWRSRALGMKRLVVARMGPLGDAEAAALEAGRLAARRAEVAVQAANAAARTARQAARKSQVEAEKEALRRTLVTLATAVAQHEAETGDAVSTETDRALWGVLVRLRLPAGGEGHEATLREAVDARRVKARRKGKPDPDVLHADLPGD